MSLNRSVKQIMPGMGSATVTLQLTNVATNAGATTNVVLPTSGNFSSTIGVGKVRVKSNVIGTNATFKVVNIIGSDGTNTVQLYAGDANATSNGAAFDEYIEFLTELKLATINVAVAVVNNNSTVDVDLAANP
jgi:hypothetical protein